MKKLVKLFSTALLTLSVASAIIPSISETVLAAEFNDNTDATVSLAFGDLTDEQLVIALPDGGFICKLDGGSDFSHFDVARNGGELVTVSEMKERWQNSEGTSISGEELSPSLGNGTSLRAANPYSQWQYVVPDRSSYRSKGFSGSGWRFSGMKFVPAWGTGDYLAWRVEGDSGMVGVQSQAISTYQGVPAGVSIYPGQRQYVYSDRNGLYFYTHNPVPGSVYIVENW